MKSTSTKLSEFIACVLAELEQNEDFAQKVEKCLSDKVSRNAPIRQKRTPAKIAPVSIFMANGKDKLEEQLAVLSIDELKDIIEQYVLDESRKSMKWKTKERIIELIVRETQQRATRGDAFRK
ncbi:MAG: hypothetical protein LBO63_01290 [Oscillospiraceae bacterium]|jgi:hypothetical protein|nr:hypothetical protein [Oscillospiraceae bacterium]